MSKTTTTTKPAPKATKAAKPAPKATKAAKPTSNGTASRTVNGDGASKGRPVTLLTPARVHVLRTLLKMGAVSSATAETAVNVGAKAKIDPQAIKHHCYDENPLYVAGLVGQNRNVEGAGRLLHYFITPAGVKALSAFDKATK